MSLPLSVYIAVEDRISEAVLQKILGEQYAPKSIITEGSGNLRSRIASYNSAAKHTPFIVLTDLDEAECPPALIRTLLPVKRHEDLILRVAVREVEAWLLADEAALLRYLRVSGHPIPRDVDAIRDPKRFVLDLSRHSRDTELKVDILPPSGSSRIQGPNYNGRMIRFIRERWNPDRASRRSQSLRRALHRLRTFGIQKST
jgi:hypothetical protein